jgi:hypothetical protein
MTRSRLLGHVVGTMLGAGGAVWVIGGTHPGRALALAIGVVLGGLGSFLGGEAGEEVSR